MVTKTLFFAFVLFLSGLLFVPRTMALRLEDQQKALGVMNYQCGACHIPNQATTKQGALKIFNLKELLWRQKLSESQRAEIVRRLKDREKISDLELSYLMPKGFKPLPVRPTHKETQLVKAYLAEAEDVLGQLLDDR